MRTIEAIASAASLYGYTVRLAPRASLGPIDGYSGPLVATFDGVECVVADDLDPDMTLFLAVHGLGHCVSWALNPGEREDDPADFRREMTTGDRVAKAFHQEVLANVRGLAIAGLRAPAINRYLEIAQDDWTAFREFLLRGEEFNRYTHIKAWILGTDAEIASARGAVRIAGAFDLP